MTGIVGQTWVQDERQELRKIIDYGKSTLEKQGSIRAQYFLEAKEGDKVKVSTMVLLFDSDEEKKELLEKVRVAVANMSADKCYVLFEGWLSKVTPGERPNIRPRYDKQREEVLMVSSFDKNLKSSTTIIPFLKKGGKITFSKEQVLEKMDTLWNPYLELDGSVEKQQEYERQIDEDFYNEQAKKLYEKYEPRLKSAASEEERKQIALEAMAEIKEIEQRIMKNIIEEDENEPDR